MRFIRIDNIQKYDSFIMHELAIQMATFFYHEGMFYVYDDKSNEGLQNLISSQVDSEDVYHLKGKLSFIVKSKVF